MQPRPLSTNRSADEMSSPSSRLRRMKRSPLPAEARRYTQPSSIASVYNLLDARYMSRRVPFRHSEQYSEQRVTGQPSANLLPPPPPPSDPELVASMAARLAKVETELNTAKEEGRLKDARIKELEQRLVSLPPPSPSPSHDDLLMRCNALQTQVQEMEEFLNDYGMMWVGKSKSAKGQVHEEGVWLPDSSTSQKAIDFDLLVKNIKYLNVLAGEGSSSVTTTPRGASLKAAEAVPLTLYANGLVMFQGPFRPFSDPHTQQCVQDLMEGYFPSELQTLFPEGVPFELSDQRHVTFVPRTSTRHFSGSGQKLGGQMRPSRIFSRSPTTARTTSEHPGPKLSTEQFLSRLPARVVRRGRVIDIRSSVSATLSGTSHPSHHSHSSQLHTPPLTRPIPPFSSPSLSLTTLKVRSETGDHTYTLNMRAHDTIHDVWTRLLQQTTPTNSSPSATPDNVASQYQLVGGVTCQVYSDLSASLFDCGLTPNAILYITKTTSSHHGNPHTDYR